MYTPKTAYIAGVGHICLLVNPEGQAFEPQFPMIPDRGFYSEPIAAKLAAHMCDLHEEQGKLYTPLVAFNDEA